MNYNEYDSNGKKKNFNFTDVLSDKKQRARVILLVYGVLIFTLIIMIRVSNNTPIEKKEKNNNEELEQIKEKDEVDEMFSLIDQNNYEFRIISTYNDIESIIEGKKFEDKYSFSLSNLDSLSFFIGTESNLMGKPSEEDSYIKVDFPYAYLNYFNNEVLKDIIRNSILNNNNYEITNEKFNDIVEKGSSIILDDKNSINNVEIIMRNNKVVSITIDYTNAISDYTKEAITAKVVIEYSNFGLVEDFDISFE